MAEEIPENVKAVADELGLRATANNYHTGRNNVGPGVEGNATEVADGVCKIEFAGLASSGETIVAQCTGQPPVRSTGGPDRI